MEGADPLITPQEAKNWFDEGVRIIAPAWRRTRYAGGTGAPGPLTADGRELMLEMERAGLILDVSHLADESFSEALDMFHGPALASHSNCRAYVPTDRQLSDEMISALTKRDGVIGTALYNGFLRSDWRDEQGTKSQVTLFDVVKHIQHVCAIAGDSLHAAIGSDFDGGFGMESIPAELDTVADLQKIGGALKAAQLSDTDVENILGGNWLRLLRAALPP
jgi:membrane dipeptidase